MAVSDMTFADMLGFLNTQPEWAGLAQIRDLSTLSKAQNDLAEVNEEIKDKRIQLQQLEKRLFALENEKVDLEEIIQRERDNNERAIVVLMRDKIEKDNHLRLHLEATNHEHESEIDRLNKRLDQEIQGRDDALRCGDALRLEIRDLEARVVTDEQALARARDLQQQLHQEIDELQNTAADQDKAISRAREAERVFSSDLDVAHKTLQHMESAVAQDGNTIVELRDQERTLRAELDQTLSKLRVISDRSKTDEQQISVLKESIKNLQLDNDNLHAQNCAYENRLTEDVATIDHLRDSESGLRRKLRLLDDVTEEVERLRGELEKHRKGTRSERQSLASPPTTPPHQCSHGHHTSISTTHSRRVVRGSPSPPSRDMLTMRDRERDRDRVDILSDAPFNSSRLMESPPRGGYSSRRELSDSSPKSFRDSSPPRGDRGDRGYRHSDSSPRISPAEREPVTRYTSATAANRRFSNGQSTRFLKERHERHVISSVVTPTPTRSSNTAPRSSRTYH